MATTPRTTQGGAVNRIPRWLFALLEAAGWCAASFAAYIAMVMIFIVGTERCGGSWLFGATEPDAGCFTPWQIGAWSPIVIVGGALATRLLVLARRHGDTLRTVFVGRRPRRQE